MMKNGIPDNLNNGIGIDPVSVEVTPPEPTPEPAAEPVSKPTPQDAPAPAEAAPSTDTQEPVAPAPADPTPNTDSQAPADENKTVIPDMITTPPVSEPPVSEDNGVVQPIPGTEPKTNDPNVANSNGFVESNKVENVGMQPPQKEKKEKPINKILFIVLVLVLMAGVAYGIYYYLSLGNNIKVNLKTVSSTVNEPLSTNVEDYAKVKGTATKNCSVITSDVDNTKIGTYEYTVKCGNNSYTGKIKIVEKKIEPTTDTSEITVDLKDVKVTIGESVSESDFIVENTCSEEDCQYTFADKDQLSQDLQKNGVYDVVINIQAGEKTAAVHANLIVLEADFKLFSSCSKPGDNVEITDKLAINEENLFAGPAYRVYKYTFASEEDYNNVANSKLSRITYNDITGNAQYNDAEKTISIVTNLDKETLNNEAGKDFPTAYMEITSYYQGNGYTCTIER